MYAVARARSGKNTGPGRVRARARSNPSVRMRISQIAVTRMLSHRPLSTGRTDLRASDQLKNVDRTSGQPGDRVTATKRIAATTGVLAAEISADRTVASWRIRLRSRAARAGPTGGHQPVRRHANPQRRRALGAVGS